jgi:hypothetical protein
MTRQYRDWQTPALFWTWSCDPRHARKKVSSPFIDIKYQAENKMMWSRAHRYVVESTLKEKIA